MSDEDTDQSIFTERNTGSPRDLRDYVMGFQTRNKKEIRDEQNSARNAPPL